MGGMFGGGPSMPPAPAAPPIPAPVIQPGDATNSATAAQARMRGAGAMAMYGGTVENQGGAQGLAAAPTATKSLLG